MTCVRKCIAAFTAAAAAFAVSARAHDFWLQPSAFTLDPGATIDIDFLIGHAGERDHWALRWERVVSLVGHGPNGIVDLQSALLPAAGEPSGGARIKYNRPGTHVLAFESRQSFIELEAEKFDTYVEKAGLTLVAQDRAAKRAAGGERGAPGTEVYGRRAKLLLQVGDTHTDNALEPVGHTLEIVPERHPSALAPGETLPVRVLFRGAPLPGATIEMQSLSLAADTKSQQETDATGRASFPAPPDGAWKLNVVWSTPTEANEEADYDTVFASLAFVR